MLCPTLSVAFHLTRPHTAWYPVNPLILGLLFFPLNLAQSPDLIVASWRKHLPLFPATTIVFPSWNVLGYQQGSLSHFVAIFCQMSPCQQGTIWPAYWKLYPISQHFLSLFWLHFFIYLRLTSSKYFIYFNLFTLFIFCPTHYSMHSVRTNFFIFCSLSGIA